MSNKDAYEKKMEAKIEEWQAEIDRLKAKSKQQTADSEIDFNEKVEKLEQKQETARSDLENIKNSSSDAWEDLKAGAEKAANDLDDAIKSAKKQFS